MFENLKAQRTGISPRERLRFTLFAVALLMVGASLLLLKDCKGNLPGSINLPTTADPREADRLQRHIDREVLREQLGDEAASHGRYVDGALEHVRAALNMGVGDVPEPITAAALDALPVGDALGRLYEVTGKVTALVDAEYRNEFERIWSVVIEGKEGGQVVAVRLGRRSEPQQGAPTDAWTRAPADIQVGDEVIVRGAYVQRRTGTLGAIALTEPTPVLLSTAFRRLVLPAALPIDEPNEAAWEEIDDIRTAGSERLDDVALYQMILWARTKGQAWFRKQIAEHPESVEDWGKDTFANVWSEEIERGNKMPPEPRPFTEGARGRLFRTPGLVGKVLREDWDALRPNQWGVHTYEYVYLWSDYYGNRVMRTISPFPFESYGFEGWQPLNERVWLYGYFIKTHTFDMQQADPEAGGHRKLSMPLFVVVDIRPFPTRKKQEPGATAIWVIGCAVVGLGFMFWWLMHRDKKEEEVDRARRVARSKRRGDSIAPAGGRPDSGAPGEGEAAGPDAPS